MYMLFKNFIWIILIVFCLKLILCYADRVLIFLYFKTKCVIVACEDLACCKGDGS